MSSPKKENQADIASLASEVMDLWQEHLAACAEDAGARSELMRLMEPQRRLFADWAALMQNGMHAGTGKQNAKDKSPGAAHGAAAAQPASDDSALRLAQLAHRTAQLEKHIKEFERRIDALERDLSERGLPGGPEAQGKTGRHPKARKSRIH